MLFRSVSSLLVTHRLQDAYYIASFRYDEAADKLVPIGQAGADGPKPLTRFLLLRDGQVLFHGGLRELLTSTDPYLRKFLA